MDSGASTSDRFSSNYEMNSTVIIQTDRTPSPTAVEYWATTVSHNVYLCYTPFLVVLGSIGNLISIVIFHNSKLRLQSTSQYLSALAISDTVFLLQLVPPWLSTSGITNLFYQGGFCQINVYISYVSCGVSAWLVVAFSVERFVAVIYPLRLNSVCTVARARLVIIGIVIVSMVVNLPMLRFTAPKNEDCSVDREYLVHAAQFNVADTVLCFTFPLMLIIFLNAWITIGVWRLEREWLELVKSGMPQLRQHGPGSQEQIVGPRSQHKVTKMLLLVSSMYVLFNLPAYIFRVIAYGSDIHTEGKVSVFWFAMQELSGLLFNTNFGINFFLYCMSGQNFRRALILTFWPRRRHQFRREVVVRRPPTNTGNTNRISNSLVSNAEVTINNENASNTRQAPFIWRWRFNTRQRQDNERRALPRMSTTVESVEMQSLSP